MNRVLALVTYAILCWGTEQTRVPPSSLTVVDELRSTTVDEIMDFPNGLLIGASISSFQHEGARDISDNSMSWIDYNERKTGTANFYHHYKKDISLLKFIGFDSFRFSISWARLLPNGTSDYISEDGLRFYNNVLDELEKQEIEPFVTIYHWDHPQKLGGQDAWLNETMIDLFANYSRVVFEKFGNRVKYFGTINEPIIYCMMSQREGIRLVAAYKCHRNMLKAHALAYHIFDKGFRHLKNGKIGIIEACDAYYPYSNDEKDIRAQEIAHEFKCGWTAHPIFSEKGDYPEIMKERIAKKSKDQHYNESRLPELSTEWIDKIKNSSDFFGLNHYTSQITQPSQIFTRDWYRDTDDGITYSYNGTWNKTGLPYFRINPQGFGDILRKIKDKYNNIPVYVLENGYPLEGGIDDDYRMKVFHSHLKEMLIAITRDKCDVRMYSLWSFLDGFEFEPNLGLSSFGIVQVDFENPNRTRTLKNSALWFKKILTARKLLPPEASQPIYNAQARQGVGE